jgi:hypothetical protein
MKFLSYFASGYLRLKRFIAWFPILWKDEDWDSAYLFEIMRFKISRMRRSIDENKIFVGYEKVVRDMRVAEELLSRIVFSDFYDDLSARLTSIDKQDKCKCPAEKYTFLPGQYDKNGKILTHQWVDLSCDFCKEHRSRWFKQEDMDFLFMHLRKNVLKWWD